MKSTLNKKITELTASEIRESILQEIYSTEEVAEAFIAKAIENDKSIQAFAWFDPNYVREQAKNLDKKLKEGLLPGNLFGVPVVLKDIIDVAHLPSQRGTVIEQGHLAKHDSEVVSQLRAAGAIIFAKSVTTELAFLEPSKTKNPHNLARTPGGSSSWSAAALAADMCALGIGTQTGGSVIRPASFCGVYAIKPSFNLISREGVLLQSETLDTLGIMGRSIDDLELTLKVTTSTELITPKPLTNAPKIAILEQPGFDKCSEEMKRSLADFSAKMAPSMIRIQPSKAFESALKARETINLFEMAKHYRHYYEQNQHSLSSLLQSAIERGFKVTQDEYHNALEIQQIIKAELASLHNEYDALILPAALGAAPGLETTGDAILNALWTFSGSPAVNLPLMKDSKGMPLGLQIIGSIDKDLELLQIARWIESKK